MQGMFENGTKSQKSLKINQYCGNPQKFPKIAEIIKNGTK